MNERHYETETINKIFLKVAIPSIFAMLFSSIGMIIDGMFVGNYIGSDAVAAVNLVMPIFMIIFTVSDMIAVGSSVKVSMALGEKEFKKADSMFSASVLIVAILGIVFLFIGNSCSQDVINFFIKDSGLATLAYEYTKPFIILLPFIMLFFMTDNFLRICGKVNLSMWINILVSIMNIFLDWYLIAYLRLDISAAAFATAVSMTIGTIVSLIPFVLNKVTLKVCKPKMSIKEFIEIVFNGSSEFLENIAGSLMAIVINGFLITLGGSSALAAFSIIIYIDSIFRFILMGMTGSLQPVISYNYGRGNRERIRSLIKISSISAFVISIISMILMLVFNEPLVKLFTSNSPEVLQITKDAIFLFAPSYLFSWVAMIVGAFLTSIDRPKESLVLMLFNSIVFPLMVLIITTKILGLYGVFATETITAILTFGLCLVIIDKLKKEAK